MSLEVVKAVFSEAAAIVPADERAAFLERACAGNPELRDRVESLLAAQHQLGDFLQAPILQQAGDDTFPLIGTRVGPYKLLEQIGEGGFGIVYMAEQEEPVRRKVALKIIKAGMDTKQVIARFEAERQALAMMDHPNIARVLDAGETQTGRPYFVMELVKGIPITDFCEQKQLRLRERLELFINVCNAVQHAHQKGIIHRDIKPSNVMITMIDGQPVPKVIDFGVAKAMEQRLTEKTLFTRYDQLIGTPAYMSPEQAELSGQDVDTRSDIYSLGCLLYELLTSTPPIDSDTLRRAGLDEIRHLIRQTDPPKPSIRLRKTPRTISPADLTTNHLPLTTDLDWIVMKCLEKERARRYETANGLALDIERHLRSEPIAARPPSTAYRLQKFVRRNRVQVGFVATLATAMLVGLLVALIGFANARRERDRALMAENNAAANQRRAEGEAARSRHIARFLTEALESVGPKVALGRDIQLLREVLDEAAEHLKELQAFPAVEADLRTTFGKVYFDLGEYAKSEAMNRKALAIRLKLHGTEEHLDVADSLRRLGWDLFELENREEAVKQFRRAVAINEKLLQEDHPILADSLYGLARMLSYAPTLDEAEQLHLRALRIRTNYCGDRHPDIALSLHGLGLVLRNQGNYAEAERVLHTALDMRKQFFGEEHPDVAKTLFVLGNAYFRQGKFQLAASTHKEVVRIRKKLLHEHHPSLADSLEMWGSVLEKNGQKSEADKVYYEVFERRKDALTRYLNENGAAHHAASIAQVHVADREEVDLLKADRIVRARSLRYLAGSLRGQGRMEEAKMTFLYAASTGDARALDSAAWFLATSADPIVRDEKLAITFVERAVAQRKDPRFLDTLATCYAAVGRFAEAVAVQEEAVRFVQNPEDKLEYTGRLNLFLAQVPYREYDRLGNILRDRGDFAGAADMYRHELAARRIMFGNDAPEVAVSLYDIAHALQAQGNFADSEEPARECLEIRETKLPDDWQTFNARTLLGATLLAQKNYSAAEPLLLSAYEGLKQRESRISGKSRLKETAQRLAQLYEQTNRPEQAAAWKTTLSELESAASEK